MSTYAPLLAIILSFIPVTLWSMILMRRHRKSMFFFFCLNFVLSVAFSALFYHKLEHLFEEYLQINVDKSRVFIGYMLIGMFIEYGKNIIVRLTGKKYFQSVDDVMDLSFATALGFTFYQDIFHFTALFSGAVPEAQGPVKMLKEVLEYIFFILPIHLFCSGIFGYFYGISIFASRALREAHAEQYGRYKLFAFRSMKILEGTFFSVIFYGLFFTMLKLDPTIGDVLSLFGFERFVIFGTEIDERLMPFISFLFFSIGTVFLFQLMDQKRSFEQQNLLKTAPSKT